MGSGEDSGREPGQERRADGRGLDLGGAHDLATSVVGDHLQKRSASRKAAVDAQSYVAEPERLADVDAAMRDTLEHGACELRPSRAASQTVEGSARAVVSERRAQALERRYEDHAIGRRDALRQRIDLRRIAHQPEVHEPLHRRTGGDHRALQAVGARAVGEAPERERVGASRRIRDHLARIHVEHGAGAECDLRIARCVGALAKHRRLLVSGARRDGDGRAEKTRVRLADHVVAGYDFCQRRARDGEQIDDRRGPFARGVVVQRRARRVARVGDVCAAPRELRRQPGIGRAEAQGPRGSCLAHNGIVAHPPFELGGRSEGVERDADGAEVGDARGGALVLPADHRRDRRHAARVPGQCRAALVHDADPRDVAGRDASFLDRATHDLEAALPHVRCVLLDPARRRVRHGQWRVGTRAGAPTGVDNEGPNARRAKIQRKQELAAHRSSASGGGSNAPGLSSPSGSRVCLSLRRSATPVSPISSTRRLRRTRPIP